MKISLSCAFSCALVSGELTVIGCIECYHRDSDDGEEKNEDRETDLQRGPSLFLLWLWSVDISYIHLTF